MPAYGHVYPGQYKLGGWIRASTVRKESLPEIIGPPSWKGRLRLASESLPEITGPPSDFPPVLQQGGGGRRVEGCGGVLGA